MSRQETEQATSKYSLDATFFRRVWKLYRMFWLSKASRKAWLLSGLLVAAVAGYTYSGASFSLMTKATTDALVARHQDEYLKFIIMLTLYGMVRSLMTGCMPLLEGLITTQWWPWLSKDTLSKLLYKKNYYNIQQNKNIDNVDQRIEEEISPVCSSLVEIPRALLASAGDVIVQAAILYTLSPKIIALVVGYTLLKFFVTYFVYRPTIRQVFKIKVAEGDLRYSLMQTKNNAEQIALLRGEKAEASVIHRLLDRAIHKTMINVRYQWFAGLSADFIELLWRILPMVILVPVYFKGQMSYGQVMQGVASASMMLMNFSVLTMLIPQVINIAPSVTRLAEIQESNEQNNSGNSHPQPCVKVTTGKHLKIINLSIYVPGSHRLLLDKLTFEISPETTGKKNIVIMGKTGSGKSSLFRVLSGLWNEGEGEVILPPQEDIFFLPQTPYLISGSLRAQFCYPYPDRTYSDELLQTVIQQVKLSEMTRRYGSLDSIENWRNCLSLGEQQRIALARVLLAKPGYLFLDEATSALDPVTEDAIYQQLVSLNINIITIAHNQTVVKYHQYLITLHARGEWSMDDVASVPELFPSGGTQ